MIDSFFLIIGFAVFVLSGLIMAMLYPLPRERQSSIWNLAKAYEEYLPGWKGKVLKYYFRICALGMIIGPLFNFIGTLFKHS